MIGLDVINLGDFYSIKFLLEANQNDLCEVRRNSDSIINKEVLSTNFIARWQRAKPHNEEIVLHKHYVIIAH